ncbi:MAG: alpha/beta hydrolase [Confluentibacter sp.]|nr:alpha/beta hydrolase [Confluentibacter sp.]
MKANLTIFLTTFFSISMIHSQETVSIWQTKVPNALINNQYIETFRRDDQGEVNGILNVTEPTLKLFLAKNNQSNNTAVVICPGGGYGVLSHEKEGDKIAEWLNTLGISAFVLKYRLPSDLIMEDKTIGPLQDAQEAIRLLRRNAEQWHLDPKKIGIIGFSAGGHLASTASTHYNIKVYDCDTTSARPDFSILIYPVISMEAGITHQGSKLNLLGKNAPTDLVMNYSNQKQVDKNTPPTFLVHATDDAAVPVENSIQYYLALKANKVPAEMHLYEHGGHGFGLGTEGTHTHWPDACENWLRAHQLISR